MAAATTMTSHPRDCRWGIGASPWSLIEAAADLAGEENLCSSASSGEQNWH